MVLENVHSTQRTQKDHAESSKTDDLCGPWIDW